MTYYKKSGEKEFVFYKAYPDHRKFMDRFVQLMLEDKIKYPEFYKDGVMEDGEITRVFKFIPN
jgi:hypothetical protein